MATAAQEYSYLRCPLCDRTVALRGILSATLPFAGAFRQKILDDESALAGRERAASAKTPIPSRSVFRLEIGPRSTAAATTTERRIAAFKSAAARLMKT